MSALLTPPPCQNSSFPREVFILCFADFTLGNPRTPGAHRRLVFQGAHTVKTLAPAWGALRCVGGQGRTQLLMSSRCARQQGEFTPLATQSPSQSQFVPLHLGARGQTGRV